MDGNATDSTAYPWKWVNILTLKTMTFGLSLRSVNSSDRIRVRDFPVSEATLRCLEVGARLA